MHNYQVHIVSPITSYLFPAPCSEVPAPCSEVPAPCFLLRSPCSEVPKNREFCT
ncbi:hypothetical protein [Moorena producens]|uniref:hypothetical protein n=1 Tax=Moorena producens TaxID=1155739 RepID=UPI00131453CB|nr:hypothetical protein [Moorena producens]